MTNYRYRTARSSSYTEDFRSILDHCQDVVDSGNKEIKIIHRAKRTQGKFLIFRPYCIIEAIQHKGRRITTHRFLEDD